LLNGLDKGGLLSKPRTPKGIPRWLRLRGFSAQSWGTTDLRGYTGYIHIFSLQKGTAEKLHSYKTAMHKLSLLSKKKLSKAQVTPQA